MRWCAMLLVVVVAACGGGSVTTKKTSLVAETKVDSCLTICAKPACLKSLTHIVGGDQIKLQGEGVSASDPWLYIPETALGKFRMDFYDIDGQRVASVAQKCPIEPPLKIDARAILGRKPNGTYFINLSHNGVPIGTARFVWKK
jgi:hypothetical protein